MSTEGLESQMLGKACGQAHGRAHKIQRQKIGKDQGIQQIQNKSRITGGRKYIKMQIYIYYIYNKYIKMMLRKIRYVYTLPLKCNTK